MLNLDSQMKLVVNLFFGLLLSISTYAQQTEYYVLFEYNKSEVPDSAMAFLIKTVYNNEVDKIYLEGHCDSIGSKRYNYALSAKRVKAVEDLLIENGFDAKKIIGKVGFGKDQPITPNSSDSARQKNRRVLVKFSGIRSIIKEKKQLVKEEPKKEKEKKIGAASLRVKKTKTPKKELGIAISRNSYNIETTKTKVQEKTTEPAPKPKTLKRENFVKDATIALPGLNFQGGRHFLLRKSSTTLDTLLVILKEHPNMVVEIQGHVCCTTTEPDGFDIDLQTPNLSLTRAIAVKAFLVKNGVSSSRLKTKGFGGTKKLFPKEENPFQRERNRRVEIKVLTK